MHGLLVYGTGEATLIPASSLADKLVTIQDLIIK
jgi:hypothetical protein